MKKLCASLLALSVIGAATLASDDADACGGCFIPVSESTVVTGHRMALSISKTQAVLWDQIQYAGDPAEFSWVLPVKRGARVEVANDAFFDVLETGTATSVQAPPEGCAVPDSGGGIGCGASEFGASADSNRAAGNNGVQILHEGTVGPYDTVTLAAENPNALTEWLAENGYELPDNIKPTVDAYVEEGFDFIALKLRPNQGVASMKPVRVITPGSNFTLPLRMVAAGVGDSVDIVLYIIGEGRYEAADFDNITVDPELIAWDYKEDRSDYATQRLGLLEGNGGRTWLTSYSYKDAILSPVPDPLAAINGGFNGNNINYTIGDINSQQSADTLASAYVLQGFENDEVEDDGQVNVNECLNRLQSVSHADAVDEESGLACGNLDDIAVALDGMRPQDVVLTRLEAKLPTAELSSDLRVEASMDQAQVASRFEAGLKTNPCWDQQSVAPLVDGKPRSPIPPEALVLLGLGAAGLALAMRRRPVTA